MPLYLLPRPHDSQYVEQRVKRDLVEKKDHVGPLARQKDRAGHPQREGGQRQHGLRVAEWIKPDRLLPRQRQQVADINAAEQPFLVREIISVEVGPQLEVVGKRKLRDQIIGAEDGQPRRRG